MTPTWRVLTLCALAYSAAACQPRDPGVDTTLLPTPDSPAPDAFAGAPTPLGVRDTNSVIVGLERGACFGTCPVYSLEVRGSGAVTFIGQAHVATTDTVRAAVTRPQIVALLRAFERARYPEIPDRYGIDKCHDATDLPSAKTSLSYDGRSLTRDHYHGCLRAPTALDSLEDAIDSIVNTAPWVRSNKML